jgi:O-methyltransferase
MKWLTRSFARLEITPLTAGLFLLTAALAGGLLNHEVGKLADARKANAGCCTLYKDLMKLSLTDLLYEQDAKVRERRWRGEDWPGRGLTMIGIPRLNNIDMAVDDVLRRGVPGDLIEAGAWRGGATMFMRAALKCRGVNDRTVWVADSFEGMPLPESLRKPAEPGQKAVETIVLATSLESVQEGFARYGLLDDRVRFLKGWFKDTLKDAPIQRLAILRVDADLYESTLDALNMLYAKVSPGGYVIVDDVGALSDCKRAVDEFRATNHVTAPIHQIDWTGIYWIKE